MRRALALLAPSVTTAEDARRVSMLLGLLFGLADHVRVWPAHQTIHRLRARYRRQHLRRGRSDLLRPVADATTGEEVEIRSLGSYDQALGLVDDVVEEEVV